MKKIKTETIISSLLVLGFNQIDPLLFCNVLGALSEKGVSWEVEDSELSPTFLEFIEYDGICYRLKDGYTLESNVSPIEGTTWPLKRALRPNEELMTQISQLNLKEIVMKKIDALGKDKIDEVIGLFSEKEKEIMQIILGSKQETGEEMHEYQKKA